MFLRSMARVLQIWQNVEILILLISHDLDEAIFRADRIML